MTAAISDYVKRKYAVPLPLMAAFGVLFLILIVRGCC